MPKVLIAVVAAIAAMTAATASAAPDDTTLASRASKREPFPPARLCTSARFGRSGGSARG
jgi:hypothetical protein